VLEVRPGFAPARRGLEQAYAKLAPATAPAPEKP
jgi:hypothetical protein